VAVGVAENDSGEAVGGIILTSDDGGLTWTNRGDSLTGATDYLSGISCPTASTCVAVGGIILTSIDSGVHWMARTSGTTQSLSGIACPNNNLCVAVGDRSKKPLSGGTILTSGDGGITWTIRDDSLLGATGYLTGVSCPSAHACVAVGLAFNGANQPIGGTILTSVDAGVTWASRITAPTQTLYGVSCPSITECLAVGSYGTILTNGSGG
jgi:photosystem II stability/assembly factor-like uncharacterized protein